MGLLKEEVFICIDCETTGLDPVAGRIIEVAFAKFNFNGIFESYQSLIDPECPISESSQAIHHITPKMVEGHPKIQEVLPKVIKAIDKFVIVGHGIKLDLLFLTQAAMRFQIPFSIEGLITIDTLRLARLYGETPTNSLEKLREHFNIKSEGAHRAMSDVIVNIEVFKYLAHRFTTTEQLLERLKKAILLKTMPLGKHKGRLFSEIPAEYLAWVAQADFDQDLLFSARTELKKRKKGKCFWENTNPFSQL